MSSSFSFDVQPARLWAVGGGLTTLTANPLFEEYSRDPKGERSPSGRG
jgi:hypothetical protein